MHIDQIENQTPDVLVEALEHMRDKGFFALSEGEAGLIKEVRRVIGSRGFLTVGQHNALVRLSIKYL